jgi:hypothetical protein
VQGKEEPGKPRRSSFATGQDYLDLLGDDCERVLLDIAHTTNLGDQPMDLIIDVITGRKPIRKLNEEERGLLNAALATVLEKTPSTGGRTQQTGQLRQPQTAETSNGRRKLTSNTNVWHTSVVRGMSVPVRRR